MSSKSSTSSVDSSNSDSKKKQEKRLDNERKYWHWFIKFLFFVVLPSMFVMLCMIIKSRVSHIRSEQKSRGDIKVKISEMEANRKPQTKPASDISVHQQSNPSNIIMEETNPNSNSADPARIQIASDLHIEFYDENEDLNFLIEPKAPILALLGDVGYACTAQLKKFLLSQCDRFEQVWFLAGNHEYYNHGTKHSVTEQDAWLEQAASERPNLHFLEKAAIPMLNGNVMVLATTLWSDIPDDYLEEAEGFLNDYHLSYNHGPTDASPRLLRANETRQWYRDNLNWLQSQLNEIYDQNKLQAHAKNKNETKVVVLTHHTPLMIGTSAPKYEGSDSTHCFSSDLKNLLAQPYSPIEVWACGHTHYNFDLAIPQSNRSDDGKLVRVVSNQRGYKNRPKPDYREDGLVLEIYP